MATLNIKGFPDGLHRKLKARAKRNRRSVAQEVTQMLSDGLGGATKPLSRLDLPHSLDDTSAPAEVVPQSAPKP